MKTASKLLLLLPLLAFGFYGNAQIRLIDAGLTETKGKGIKSMIIADTLHIREDQLIEGFANPSRYLKFRKNSISKLNDWQPMVEGLSYLIEKTTDSTEIRKSTPYHLLPLLKNKDDIFKNLTSRWQSTRAKGVENEN